MANRSDVKQMADSSSDGLSRRALLRGLAMTIGAAALAPSTLENCFGEPAPAIAELRAAARDWKSKRTSASLNERFEALSQVVKTKEPEAFKILVSEFLAKDSQKHQDKLLELIAPLAAESFGGIEFDADWEKLFTSKEFSSTNLNNCWLVYCVYMSRMPTSRSGDVASFASRNDVPVPFRVATLRILAASEIPSIPFIESVLASIPKSPTMSPDERGSFVEAIAGLLKTHFRFRPLARGAATPQVVLDLIAQLDEANIPPRSIRRLGRIVADVVGSSTVFKDSESWLAYINGRKSGEKLRAEGYAVPDEQTQYFFGAKGTGLSFCFVIDMSSSMADPLSLDPETSSKPPTKKGPVTGEGEGNSKEIKDPSNPVPNVVPGIKDPTRDKNKTRLDAAKEALIASLRQLPPDASFSIVVFGDEGKVLVDDKNMLAATPRNIEAAIAAVDKLAVMGRTNLHRGVELAFEIGSKGIKKLGPTTAPTLYDGPDAVFILSDGVPNRDSYTTMRGLGTPYLFEDSQNLTWSIKRMNLLRNSILNFIKIDDDNVKLFSFIAEQTGGTLVQIGK